MAVVLLCLGKKPVSLFDGLKWACVHQELGYATYGRHTSSLKIYAILRLSCCVPRLSWPLIHGSAAFSMDASLCEVMAHPPKEMHHLTASQYQSCTVYPYASLMKMTVR